MGKWEAKPDPFSHAMLDTDNTAFHVCDITTEEDATALLSDIADAHNADIERLTAERDDARAKLDAVQDALVPVPVGEPVRLFQAEMPYIKHEGRIYQSVNDEKWYTLDAPADILTAEDDDTLVQPVKLVRVRDMEARNDG